MASAVSDTDIQVFAELANPGKAHVSGTVLEALEGGDAGLGRGSESEDAEDAEERSSSRSDASSRDEDEEDEGDEEEEEEEQDEHSDDEAGSAVADHRSYTPLSAARSTLSNASRRSAHGEGASGLHAVSTVSRRSLPPSRAGGSAVSAVSAASRASSRRSTYGKGGAPPVLPRISSYETDGDIEFLDKQQCLMDMERLKLQQGIKFSKEWSTSDRLEDMQFELRRHSLHLDEINNINMMRDGMRLMCSGVEMLNSRVHLLELDGWAQEVCADMDKYNNALGRIYRKYWRKSTQSSPEMEILTGLISSMGMHHFKQKMQNKMFPKPTNGFQGFGGAGVPSPPARRSASPSSGKLPKVEDSGSDTDESMPP